MRRAEWQGSVNKRLGDRTHWSVIFGFRSAGRQTFYGLQSVKD
jgi:hypothetical protein